MRLLLSRGPDSQVGDLTGHTASISHIALDERLNHVFTLSVDKVIKVCAPE